MPFVDIAEQNMTSLDSNQTLLYKISKSSIVYKEKNDSHMTPPITICIIFHAMRLASPIVLPPFSISNKMHLPTLCHMMWVSHLPNGRVL